MPIIVFSRSDVRTRGSVLKGCLIAAGVVLVIAIIAGVFVARSWKGWFAESMKIVANQTISASQIPSDQKARITARVEAVAADFKAGKITTEQLTNAMQKVGESPILPLALVLEVDAKHLATSKLSDEEKAAGRRSLERFARGAVEKSIATSDIDAVMNTFTVADAHGMKQLKGVLSEGELRAALDSAKAKADAAKVPDESYSINFADEVDKVIDGALK